VPSPAHHTYSSANHSLGTRTQISFPQTPQKEEEKKNKKKEKKRKEIK
jgi:hypothetical protein